MKSIIEERKALLLFLKRQRSIFLKVIKANYRGYLDLRWQF